MSDEKEDVKPKFKTAQEESDYLDVEIKKAQLEDIQLQKLERQYSLRDLKARLADRDVKELQLKEDREAQGRTFATQRATDEHRWGVCTHKKGGVVTPRDMRVLSTGGNGQQYAILKHQMINGDIWVRCLRCGKTWTPPVKEKFYFDTKTGRQVPPHVGEFSDEKFKASIAEYRAAVNFETNNSMSGSVQCRFSKYNPLSGQWDIDAASEYRLNLMNTNLR